MRIIALCLLAMLTACAKTTTSSTPAPNATPVPTASAALQTTTPASAAPQSTRCHTADLTGAVQDSGAAAGTAYRYVVLTNSSGPTCTLYGYPGVSLVDASGAILGKPAERNPVRSPEVQTLQPHESTYALVGFPNPGNFPPGKCTTGTSASMRVYPPDELRSLLVTVHEQYCPGFSVSPLGAKV